MNDTPPPLPWERPTSAPISQSENGKKIPLAFFHDVFQSPAKAIWVVGAILAILLLLQKSEPANSSSVVPIPTVNPDMTPFRDTQRGQQQFWRDYGN